MLDEGIQLNIYVTRIPEHDYSYENGTEVVFLLIAFVCVCVCVCVCLSNFGGLKLQKLNRYVIV